jgi:hypothetical protein
MKPYINTNKSASGKTNVWIIVNNGIFCNEVKE